VVDRFATAVKWWVLAPFSYAIKQYGTYMPALYQYGPPNTGKSTINLIGSMIWGFTYRELEAYEDHEVPGESINTPAKLEHWIRMGTFPIPVREPRSVFENTSTIDMLKSAIESRMVRGKHRGGVYVTAPALADFSFTSNTYIPEDTAFVGKRVYVLKYTYAEVLNPEKPEHRELMDKFELNMKPQLGKLKAIGKFIASRVLENPGVLKGATWVGHRWLDVAEKLLAEAYNKAGLTPPDWIKLRFVTESISEIYEDKRELVREFLVKRINEEYNKFVGRIVVEKPDGYPDVISRQEADLKTRAEVVLNKQLIPWLLLRGNEVVIVSGIIKELESIVGDIGGMKSLAELLGWEYDPKFTMREGKRVKGSVAIKVTLGDFIEFLSPIIEAPETSSQEQPLTQK
jgi:hypothetical protein